MVQGEQFNASLTCLGSPPLKIDARLFYPNGTIYEESWSNNSNTDCFLLIKNITMAAIGEYKLLIEVTNDVSKEFFQQSISVVEPIPSAVIPIICICIVMAITFSRVLSIFIANFFKKKPDGGETADFNFHSTLASPEAVRIKNNSIVFKTLQFFATHLQDIVNVIQQNSHVYDAEAESSPIIPDDESDIEIDESKYKTSTPVLNVL